LRKIILTLFLLLISYHIGDCCSCLPYSIPGDVKSADLIFIGTPISKDAIVPKENFPFQYKYHFQIEEVLKSGDQSIKDEIVILSDDSDYGCGAHIDMHEKQIIFAQLFTNEYFSYCANNNFVLAEKSTLKLNYIKANIYSNGLLSVLNFIIVFALVILFYSIKKFRKKKS